MDSSPRPSRNPPGPRSKSMPDSVTNDANTRQTKKDDDGPLLLTPTHSLPSSHDPPPITLTTTLNGPNTHGLDLPWMARDLSRSPSSAAITAPSSPLTHRVSELNLSAHPSRPTHLRKSHQTRTSCFVHSMLQNGRAQSPSRSGSTDDLTRGSMLEVINKGPERRDRWNRGMTKKELSDMALGVRELSKRLGMFSVNLLLRLGGARMKLHVRTVIIITKKHDHTLVGMTRQVTDWLLKHSTGKREPYAM